MASPPISHSLLQLAARPFSFYPAIVNIKPNEWKIRKASWQELVVVNARTGLEISVPRRYVGEISAVGDPILIVGLLRELQYKDGAVAAHHRRVIEMPMAVGDRVMAPAPRRSSPAPVIGIRLEPRRERRVYKIVGGAMAMALFLYGATANLIRVSDVWQRNAARRHAYLTLGSSDGYAAVTRKLGAPATDRRQTQTGVEYRALGYRRFTVILAGAGDDAHYLGTLDDNWKPLDSPPQSLATLRQVRRF